MIECWHQDKTKRPNFSDIVNRLDELIRSPEFLKGDSSSLPEVSFHLIITECAFLSRKLDKDH